MKISSRPLPSEPEETQAIYHRENANMLFVRKNDYIPFDEISRELVIALLPDEDPGPIASGIYMVLEARTKKEASSRLDNLGFASVSMHRKSSEPTAQPYGSFGGEDIEPVEYEGSPITDGLIEDEKEEEVSGDEIKTPEDAVKSILGKVPKVDSISPDKTVPIGGTIGYEGLTGKRGTGSTETGRSPSERPTRSSSRSRLRSYVDAGDSDSETKPDSETVQHRSEIEEAGIELVVGFEKKENRKPEVMPPQYPGYDIESKAKNGRILRYIEVKSLAGKWGQDGVGLSKTQFEKARELGDKYWLYVVEKANQPDVKIFPIQNPALRVDQFLYDDGWSSVAICSESKTDKE